MRRLSRPVRWLMAVGLAVAVVQAVAPWASAADDYPYKSASTGGVDPWGFYYRQCASFVAFRMNQRGTFKNRMTGPNGVQADWYNATNWDETARKIGYAVDTTPVRGSIAQWNGNEVGAHDLGHVAVVDQVNADGTVYVEEYNWTHPYGYSRRGPLRAPRYLHVYDDAPAAIAPPQPTAPPSPPAATSPPAPIVTTPSTRAPKAPVHVEPQDTTAPIARLSLSATRVFSGDTIRIGGEFMDDRGLDKVNFFVGVDGRSWRPIGTVAQDGSHAYGVDWKVDYPVGVKLRFAAAAFDEAGNKAIDSVGGVEVVSLSDDRPSRAAAASGDTGKTPSNTPLGPAGIAGALAVVLASFAVMWRKARTRRSIDPG